MGGAGSRSDEEYDDEHGEYDEVHTDSSPDASSNVKRNRRQRVVVHRDDDNEEEDDGDDAGSEEEKAVADEPKTRKGRRKRKRKQRPVVMGATVASAAKTVAADEPSGSRPPPVAATPAAKASDVDAKLHEFDGLCCGSCCGVCCNCSTDPEKSCWARMCNHRDHVRSYIGNYMIARLEYASFVCVLLPLFLVLWAIEDTSTRSSVALSWNSHIVFSPLYALTGIGFAVSTYQAIKTTNKSYIWAGLWFFVLLASAVLFRQSRDQKLDSDPVVYRGLRYTAWLLLLFLYSFTGIMHIMHLFSGKFKEVSDELNILVKPGAMDMTPTCCQNVCGPKESISVYLTSMAVSEPGVFITAFVLGLLSLIGLFFDDATPTTIDSFSSSRTAIEVHAILIPLYAALTMFIITGLVDAIVQRRFAHVWSSCFWTALGGGIAMIRHSDIHKDDNDRIAFDGLRISGWITLISETVLIFTLHTARLPTYIPIVEQVSDKTPRLVGVAAT